MKGQTVMPKIEITCSRCGAGEYQLLDTRTGEVICHYCRSQWIVPELQQKSQTEKFLEEQAKQPRIIRDNTTETDQKLMEMVTGLVSKGPLGAVNGFIRKIIFVVALIIILFVVCLFVSIFGGWRLLFG
jgi:uncharacterized Zn finger protein (UPF0148 family)